MALEPLPLAMMDPASWTILGVVAQYFGGAAAIAALIKKKGIIRWLRLKVSGSSIMMAGPSGAGKTSFLEFLKNGKVPKPDDEHIKTPEVVKHGPISVNMTGNTTGKVSKAIDIPGQLPKLQIAEIVRRKPMGLFMFCSLKDSGDIEWSKQFLLTLAETLILHNAVKKKLKAIFIVLNKSDRVSPSHLAKYLESITTDISEHILPVLGAATPQIEVMTCSLCSRHEVDKLVLRAFMSLNQIKKS